MIVEMEITVPLEYLGYVKNYLNKIKLPMTKDQERDITNMTALTLAKSNVIAVINHLERVIKDKKNECDEMDEILRKDKV